MISTRNRARSTCVSQFVRAELNNQTSDDLLRQMKASTGDCVNLKKKMIVNLLCSWKDEACCISSQAKKKQLCMSLWNVNELCDLVMNNKEIWKS